MIILTAGASGDLNFHTNDLIDIGRAGGIEQTGARMAVGFLSPVRAWLKFRAQVKEEIGFLIERYGARAPEAALEELKRPGLALRRARVLQAAARQLQR